MLTPARIRNHPLHPMLIVLPLGLWIFSFISDLVYLWGYQKPVWDSVAYYTMMGGIAGAVLAALPGYIDWVSLEKGSIYKTIGTWHMLLNVTALALYVYNLWWRTNQPERTGGPALLSGVTVLMLSISGWLGGAMVYEHGVGVRHR